MTAPELLLPEDPLDRLNYFNSQRLEAIDFRLEQAYHMRVRRWLNRSLYSTGIAEGLEVEIDPLDKHTVMVSPGLALDALGREIILLNQRKVMACGTPRRADGITFGNYLVIAYREEKVAPQSDGCRVRDVYDNGLDACGCKRSALETNGCNGGCGCSGCKSGKGCQCGPTESEAYAWGAPSRIRSEPLLMFQDSWPTESSGKILLAQIEMDAQCRVIGIKSGMRRYASASRPPTTTQLSLEGEKDIDKDNPKVLRFHVEGQYPDTALLYLQGALFSRLYYTELGNHTHVINASTSEVAYSSSHNHGIANFKLKNNGDHKHKLKTQQEGNTLENEAENDDESKWSSESVESNGDHGHDLEAFELESSQEAWEHDHEVTASAVHTGAGNVDARTGNAYGYINNLQILFATGNATTDITADVLAQLSAVDPIAWSKLGNGSGNHALVKQGTPAIDLRQIDSVDLTPGTAHSLIFQVTSGGGQILYNLYVR